MAFFKEGRVLEIIRERPSLTEVKVEVDKKVEDAINYNDITGKVRPGDKVILNITAMKLNLGTGEKHFILWNLRNKSVSFPGAGHIMKLRYTPLQINCLSVEEQESQFHHLFQEEQSLEKMPVVIGSLHSQLPAVAVTVKEIAPETRIVYLMTDGGALPLAFSELVDQLKSLNLIDTTITIGHAFGGDLEAINIYSGLIAARVVAKAEIALVMMGPGVVGTDTLLGYSGIEQGQIINAVSALKGRAIAIPRLSFQDKRPRHYGISHHTLTALSLIAMAPALIPFPSMDREKMKQIRNQLRESKIIARHRIEVIENNITLPALEKYGIKVTTMGRSIDEEPEFFNAAGAAGIAAVRMLKKLDD